MNRPRLTAEEAAAVLAGATPIPSGRGASSTRPAPFTLERESDEQRTIAFDDLEHRVLLLFVSADCQGCEDVLSAPREPAYFGLENTDQVLLVTRSPEEQRSLGDAEIWSSAEAFTTCRVSGPPFFCLLDPAYETVATEGVVWGLDSIRSAVATALAGAPEAEVPRLEPPQ